MITVIMPTGRIRKLIITPKTTYDSNSFWYVSKGNQLPSVLSSAESKLSKIKPVSSRKLLRTYMNRNVLECTAKVMHSGGKIRLTLNQTVVKSKTDDQWDGHWFREDKDWVFEQAKQ